MDKRGFASDNNAGVHPLILQAITEANRGHTIAYGDDPYTGKAVRKFKELFGEQAETYFVFIGTAANVLGLNSAIRTFNSIICAETAHIHTDECGAPERFTGCKVLTADAPDGKINIEGIKKHMHSFGFEHHSQPAVISITQSTELGTVYTPEEIRKICRYAHSNNLVVHMDGARLANAVASLGINCNEMTTQAGVDILSFGGTKNGMMYGEAVVFLNPSLAADFKYFRKQAMQLASKMRFISAQFIAYLSDDLWLKNAAYSNRMAQILYEKVRNIKGVTITQKVEANGVFAIIPGEIIPELQKEYFFYVWDEERSEVRWMTSFDTTEEDISRFTEKLRQLLKGR